MSLDYINEAFRSLESLNEDIFSADRDGINELSDFMSSDVDDKEKISIIDMDAETEDDLQDSYVGKIICDCNVCHSHVFKDKDQITIDEDGVVDIEDDCPYCGEHNGFVIIGEITEFNPNAKEEVAEETTENEEATEEPAEEADNEPAEEVDEEEVLDESLNESPRKFKPHTMKLLRMIGSDLATDLDEDVADDSLNEFLGLGKKFNKYSFLIKDMDAEPAGFNMAAIYKQLRSIIKNNAEKIIKDKLDSELGICEFYATEKQANAIAVSVQKLNPKKFRIGYSQGELGQKGTSGSSATDVVNKFKALTKIKMIAKNVKVEESFNNVSIETDDQKMTMTSEENGKVTVTTEPLEEAPAEGDGEMITPISDEAQDEIIDATAQAVEEEPAEETADTEAETQDASETEEAPAEEEVDAEIDELDEEGMDELGESYLRKVYENVDSFKTSAVSTSGNKLFIEGMINFKSGASKKTGFIFEAKEATRDGKVKFIGENAHFCRGKRAFMLSGSLNEKKLMVESLTYNYRAKNSEGKSTRVYGTISRNK